ncbi:EamA family transporter [Pseudoroseicyclus tamaricis]|uniref:EamA family transporter n=1 Tax=Pseudoroseicyclus tamaricis TaxID=2705421 RepID=A0A6B2JQV9_9RHOB|nr:EamA family transporter [Pseudoroseicyclus tamaricis]NDV00430.1 EamA family transporter [Pseudoroseicyclus tamaricis]
MEPWILITLAAAGFQALRFATQKHLKTAGFSSAGATFARFVYSAPLVPALMLGWAAWSGQAVPALPAAFWPYALAGGLAQILATLCTVTLFSMRNFAVGMTLKKTEVLMSVLVGWVVLGEGVSLAGFAAMLVGFGGVLLLTDTPALGAGWRRLVHPAAGLGLLSGLLFGLAGVGYRGASLSLPGGDAVLRALVTLMCVTAAQAIGLGLWMAWRQRAELAKVARGWRVGVVTGLTSLAGSFCWFTAFTLQRVGYVNAVGQVELIFSLALSALWFGERISRREWQGLLLLTGSITALVLVA